MKARLFCVGSEESMEIAVKAAADAIKEGKLVVFPTETVYGIGCNALDRNAVKCLYAAKKRPLDKPLLLHLYSMEQAEQMAVLNDEARALLRAFTPGPLSVILPKRQCVPYEVTSGGETVGLRFPSNPLFLSLAREAGVPIAATSANLSGFSSAKDGKAAAALADFADVILDGGVCEYALESTVLSLVGTRPKLIRQGALSKEKIEEVIGRCD